MMLLKGYPVIKAKQETMSSRVEELVGKGITPNLTIIRVGCREDDLSYERGAVRRCSNVGVHTDIMELDESISTQELIEVVNNAGNNDKIHGILLFRPLPNHIDEKKVISSIPPEKDVDCCTSVNLAKVFSGDPSGFAPCTPEAVVEMLKFYEIPLEGSRVTIIGRSMVVGRPLAMLLIKENATIKICHTRTRNIEDEAKSADILVVAAGRAEIVDETFVNSDSVVIDVGINVNSEGKLVGDVAFDKVSGVAKAVSPVPKGVGGITTAVLAEHVIRAAENTL